MLFSVCIGSELIPENSELVHSFKKPAFLVLLALLCGDLGLPLDLLIIQLPPARVPENCLRINRVQRLCYGNAVAGLNMQRQRVIDLRNCIMPDCAVWSRNG
jgi:hypothetical protein